MNLYSRIKKLVKNKHYRTAINYGERHHKKTLRRINKERKKVLAKLDQKVRREYKRWKDEQKYIVKNSNLTKRKAENIVRKSKLIRRT